ncbi:Transient receptor potential cation channel protein painless [Sergentomyia squamirostris]
MSTWKDAKMEMSAINPSVCLTDIQAMLTRAFEGKNLDQFRQALALGADPMVKDAKGHFNLFELVCQQPSTAAYIEACIKSGISDTKNSISGKETINFLANSLDPNNLEMFLRYFPNTDVNVRDEDLTPIHVVLKSLSDSNFNDCFECVKLLVKYGADVNIPDHREFTPILTVAKSKTIHREEIIKFLLENCRVELDEFRDGEARAFLQKKYKNIKLPVKTEADRNFDYFAKHLVSIQNAEMSGRKKMEEKFLTEFRNYFSVGRSEEEKRKILTESNTDGTLLGIATKIGSKEIVKELLKKGVDPNGSKGSKPPLAIACIHGQWDVLDTLLECENIEINYPNDPPLCLIVKKLGEPSNTTNCDYQKCFEKLVANPKTDINQRDKCGSTALHYAVRYKEEKAVQALLDRNTYLGTRNRFQDLPITDMSPTQLEEYFDSRITTNGKRAGDEELEIYFDYSCLVPPDVCESTDKFCEEMTPIYEMTKSTDLRHLLKHPLISSFLFLKWHRLGAIFYGNLILYSISTLTIILYILLCYGKDVSPEMSLFMLIVSTLGVLFIIIRECSQFITAPIQYFRQMENYLEMTIIGISIVVLSGYDVTDHTRRVIAAILILLSAIEFSLLVGSLPHLSISTHMVMLKTVSITFIRSLMLYSILLIAFAFCFYTLLGGVGSNPNGQVDDEFNKFMDPGTAIIKTIVMMTGEFEAANIEFKSNTLSYLFFLLFVFFMSVVLFNLLNGLAVSDTQAIKAEAELTGFITRAEVLTRYEKLVFGHNPGSWFQFISNLCYFRKIAKRFISVFPYHLPESILVLYPNRGNRVYNHSTTAKSVRNELADNQEGETLLKKPGTCCFGCAKCTSLDGKIVRYTKKVLEKKQWQDEAKLDKLRMYNMAQKLHEIEQKLNILLRDRV